MVSLAVEAANTALLSSLTVSQRFGVMGVTFVEEDLFLTAETACTAVLQGIERLLDQEIVSMDSSKTIDLGAAAAAGGASGTLSAQSSCSLPALSTHISTSAVCCVPAGNLMTVSQKLYVGLPARSVSQRALQQQPLLARPPTSELVGVSFPGAHQGTEAHSGSAQQSGLQARQLANASTAYTNNVPAEPHLSPKRYIARHQQIVGGVFLHQTREDISISCSTGFTKKLAHECLHSQLTGQVTRGVPVMRMLAVQRLHWQSVYFLLPVCLQCVHV